jgi:uncharacterized protein involved in type VI secretion and phage assembly
MILTDKPAATLSTLKFLAKDFHVHSSGDRWAASVNVSDDDLDAAKRLLDKRGITYAVAPENYIRPKSIWN